MRRVARFALYLGTVGVVLGLGKYHAAEIGHYDYTGSFRFAWSFAYIAMLGAAAYGMGLPDLARGWRRALLPSLAATGAAAFGVSLLQLLVGSALLPRFVVFGALLLLVPWYAACAAMASGGRARLEDRDRVLLVGGVDEAETLRDDLACHPERPATLVAVIPPADALSSGPRARPLVELAVHERVVVVVLDRQAQAEESVVRQAASLHEAGVRVRTLSLFYDEWLGKLPLPELERVSLMFDIGELHRARYVRGKRVVDVLFGLAGVVMLALLVPFVFAGNLVANRGPIFYRQPRTGKNGATFSILKFRTMRPGAGPTTWTGTDDPRITPFGAVLRRTHLDEAPQVVNILRGDLAIVGPRPEQPQYVAELLDKVPFYNLRHLVRPGLTGWAQVKYAYGASEADALEKLQYDFYYLRHQGVVIDLRIVGRTLRSVIGGEGR